MNPAEINTQVLLSQLTERRRRELDQVTRGVLPGETEFEFEPHVDEVDRMLARLGVSPLLISQAYLNAHTDPLRRSHELIGYFKDGVLFLDEALRLAYQYSKI